MHTEDKLIDVFAAKYTTLSKYAIMIVKDKDAALDVMQNVALVIAKKAYEINEIKKPNINVFDAYIKYVVLGGVFTSVGVVFSIIIPAFSKNSKQLKITVDGKNDAKQFFNRYFFKAFYTGLTFVIVNILTIIILYIFTSKTALYTGLGFGTVSTFGSIRLNQPFIYVGLYNIHVLLFVFCMNVFFQSLIDALKYKRNAIIIIMFYFYSNMFLPWHILLSSNFVYIGYIFPIYLYGFLTYNISPNGRLLGYAIILIISYFVYKVKLLSEKKQIE